MEKKNEKPASLPLAKGRVTDYTEVWVGSSPKDLGLPEGNQNKIEITELVGSKITIYGYSERKGDTGDFVICLFSKDGRTVDVMVTGAAVVVRKLREVGKENGFPVEATVASGDSTTVKNAKYYDLK